MLAQDVDVPGRIACFHAQQAAEKALKAALVTDGIPFRRTHDIVVLAGLLPLGLARRLATVDLLVLQPWAVEGRYPGDLADATTQETHDAVAVAGAVLAAVVAWIR